MTDALPTTYNSTTNLSMGSIPKVGDPDTYLALLDIHNAIETLLKSSDADLATVFAYIAKRRAFSDSVVIADYTVLVTDGTVRVDASAGDVIVTLYPVANGPGYRQEIKRVDETSGNSVTLLGDGTELVDGHAAGIDISILSSYTVKAHDTGWDII